MDLAEMLQADDADAVLEEVCAWQNIDRLFQPLNGEKATLAWIAANIGAERIVSLLVARGADVEFKANGMSIRGLGMLKPQILRGIAAAGVDLTTIELGLLFTSTLPSDIPTDENYDFLHEAAQISIVGAFAGDLTAIIRQIRNAPIFRAKFGSQSDLAGTSA